MSQALYRRYRPQSWDKVIGQQHVVGTLRNALASGRQAHAYLFAGPRGTGKTTTARLLAKAVNCLDDDLARRPCGNCAHCQRMVQGAIKRARHMGSSLYCDNSCYSDHNDNLPNP